MKFLGFVVRIVSCFLLVFATWNPVGYNYLDWVQMPDGSPLSVRVAAGSLLVLLHAIYLRVSWVSLGVMGILTGVAMSFTSALVLRQLQWVDFSNPETRSFMILTYISLLLGMGVSWSSLKRRVTGQSHVLSPPP